MTIIREHDSVIKLLTVPHIGIDEAGRGCLAGPVVAAAVYFTPHFDFSLLSGLDDSKKLTEHQRNRLTPLIKKHATAFGIGLSWPLEIDRYNIVNATFHAMSRAIIRLASCHSIPSLPVLQHCQIPFLPGMGSPTSQQGAQAAPVLPLLYIDGNLLLRNEQWLAVATLPASQWHIPFFPQCSPLTTRAAYFSPATSCNKTKDNGRKNSIQKIENTLKTKISCPIPFPKQIAIIKGDARIPSIAAASVLAKTYRDALMQRLDNYFPGYQIARHKGYGTKIHRDALEVLGPSSLHRLTFLKKIMSTKDSSISLFLL